MATSMGNFEKVLKHVLDTVGQNTSVQKIYALIYIGRNSGAGQKEICQALRGTRPTVNRFLLQMTDRFKDKGRVQQGDGLLEFERDYEDNRVQRAYLSPKGQALYNQIQQILEEK